MPAPPTSTDPLLSNDSHHSEPHSDHSKHSQSSSNTNSGHSHSNSNGNTLCPSLSRTNTPTTDTPTNFGHNKNISIGTYPSNHVPSTGPESQNTLNTAASVPHGPHQNDHPLQEPPPLPPFSGNQPMKSMNSINTMDGVNGINGINGSNPNQGISSMIGLESVPSYDATQSFSSFSNPNQGIDGMGMYDGDQMRWSQGNELYSPGHHETIIAGWQTMFPSQHIPGSPNGPNPFKGINSECHIMSICIFVAVCGL